jgi:hypothetical protein
MRIVCSLLCVVVLGLGASHKESVSITVAMSSDPTGRYSSSKLYVASVENRSGSNEVFEVFKMPGGFVGSGTFFNCSVEQWNLKARKWVVFRRTRTDQYPTSSISKLELKPGEIHEACRAMLPHEGTQDGACVRFAVRSHLRVGGQVFTSKAFRVGREPEDTTCATPLQQG